MNTQTKQALEMAIQWMESPWNAPDIREKVINACKEALEAEQVCQAQEPVAWMPIETAPKDNKRALYLAKFDMDGKLVELDFDAEWVYEEESWEMSHINYWYWRSNTGIEEPTHWAYQDEPIPPYKQPAQEPVSLGDFDNMSKAECVDYIEYLRKEIDLLRFKEWQGLTDDEILAIPVGSRLSTARAIEQALKEKNHG
jgi:hypothetical protein